MAVAIFQSQQHSKALAAASTEVQNAMTAVCSASIDANAKAQIICHSNESELGTPTPHHLPSIYSKSTNMRYEGTSPGTSSGSDSEFSAQLPKFASTGSVAKGFIRSVTSGPSPFSRIHSASRRADFFLTPQTAPPEQFHNIGEHKQSPKTEPTFIPSEDPDTSSVSPSGSLSSASVRSRTDDTFPVTSNKLARSKSDNTHSSSAEQNRLRIERERCRTFDSRESQIIRDQPPTVMVPDSQSVQPLASHRVSHAFRDHELSSVSVATHPRSRSCAPDVDFISQNIRVSNQSNNMHGGIYHAAQTVSQFSHNPQTRNESQLPCESPPSYSQLMVAQTHQIASQHAQFSTDNEQHYQLASYRRSHNFSLVEQTQFK